MFRFVYKTLTIWAELEQWPCFLQTLLASLRTPALKSGNLALANHKHMLVLLIKHIYNARVPSLLYCFMFGAHADLTFIKYMLTEYLLSYCFYSSQELRRTENSGRGTVHVAKYKHGAGRTVERGGGWGIVGANSQTGCNELMFSLLRGDSHRELRFGQ